MCMYIYIYMYIHTHYNIIVTNILVLEFLQGERLPPVGGVQEGLLLVDRYIYIYIY